MTIAIAVMVYLLGLVTGALMLTLYLGVRAYRRELKLAEDDRKQDLGRLDRERGIIR